MATPNSTKPAKTQPEPRHYGGGWYKVVLPDGTETNVQGRPEAYEAAGLPAPDGKKTTHTVRRERRQNKITVEDRRAKVAELLVRKAPYRQIAQTFGVSLATVASDVAAIREAWREETLTNIDQIVVEELAAIDADEFDVRMLIQQTRDPDTKLRGYDRIIKLRERRAKLLGLDAPTVHRILGRSDEGVDENLIFRTGGSSDDYIASLQGAMGIDPPKLRAIDGGGA